MKAIRKKYIYYDGALAMIGYRGSLFKISCYKSEGTIWFRVFGFGLYYSLYRNEFKVLYPVNKSFS